MEILYIVFQKFFLENSYTIVRFGVHNGCNSRRIRKKMITVLICIYNVDFNQTFFTCLIVSGFLKKCNFFNSNFRIFNSNLVNFIKPIIVFRPLMLKKSNWKSLLPPSQRKKLCKVYVTYMYFYVFHKYAVRTYFIYLTYILHIKYIYS